MKIFNKIFKKKPKDPMDGFWEMERTIERHAKNGRQVRALCSEMGVSTEAYDHIVLHQMDEAKKIAMSIGRRGESYHKSPWNIRLAVAIASIDKVGGTIIEPEIE